MVSIQIDIAQRKNRVVTDTSYRKNSHLTRLVVQPGGKLPKKGKHTHMKLHEFVAQAKDDEVMHIGSASGFFFIGTKAEFYSDLNELNAKFINSAKCTIKNFTSELRSTQNNGLKFHRVETHTAKELADDWQIACESAYKTLNKCVRTIRIKNEYLKNYIQVEEREVKEVYDRKEMKDGIVIVIEGPENGAYWFREEYITKTVQVDSEQIEDIGVEE